MAKFLSNFLKVFLEEGHTTISVPAADLRPLWHPIVVITTLTPTVAGMWLLEVVDTIQVRMAEVDSIQGQQGEMVIIQDQQVEVDTILDPMEVKSLPIC